MSDKSKKANKKRVQFWRYRAIDLPVGILDFLNDFFPATDVQANRIESSTG